MGNEPNNQNHEPDELKNKANGLESPLMEERRRAEEESSEVKLDKNVLREQLLPRGKAYRENLKQRKKRGAVWGRLYFAANVVAILALLALAYNIANSAFGYVIFENEVEPAALSTQPLEELDADGLGAILLENTAPRLRVIIRNRLSRVENSEYTSAPLSEVLRGRQFPDGAGDLTINDLEDQDYINILKDNLSVRTLRGIVVDEVVQPEIVESWSLMDSIFNRGEIEARFQERQAQAEETNLSLEFYSWLRPEFITDSVASSPTEAGLRTALLGSMWVILVTFVFAFPVGVGAALYLEEYATGDNWFERIIETNIRNLAGVPSIIYGMLGLAVFVRALGFITSGEFLGITDSNGRTVVSAGLTLGLLILPVIIINGQEAIRAVPSSIRQASYGLGATKWQTIWRQILPASIPGILTGVILSMSRAVGETAPLIVVGASTFIGIDPNGPFSKFTVVPIQIYQWTARPEAEFRNIAAAAIIVLLILLVLLNGTAILLRNRFSKFKV